MFCFHVDSDVIIAAIVMSTKHQGSNHCCSYIYIDLPFAFLPKKYPSVPAFISPSERSASVPKHRAEKHNKTLQQHKSSSCFGYMLLNAQNTKLLD